MDIGQLGFAAAISLAAIGSALGTGIAGMAAIGAWKKCFAQNKPAPFLAVAFAGAPLTQTIYGLILMNALIASSWVSLEARPLAFPPYCRAKPVLRPRMRLGKRARASSIT